MARSKKSKSETVQFETRGQAEQRKKLQSESTETVGVSDGYERITGCWLAKVSAPHFVTNIILDPEANVVWAGAPVVAYMVGWPQGKVVWHCDKKGWKVRRVT